MQRIERQPKLIYRDRNLLRSILFLYLVCLDLVLLWTIREGGVPLLRAFLMMSLPFLALGAFSPLFIVRAFIIDRGLGELRVVERVLFSGSQETRLSLEDLFVWIVVQFENPSSPVVVDRRAVYRVLIRRGIGPAIVFASGRHLDPLRARAQELARDMARPLLVERP